MNLIDGPYTSAKVSRPSYYYYKENLSLIVSPWIGHMMGVVYPCSSLDESLERYRYEAYFIESSENEILGFKERLNESY